MLDVGQLKGLFLDSDVEAETRRYMNMLRRASKDGEIYKPNKTKYTRIEIPTFDDEIEKKRWGLEQIRRCKEGHNGMSGKHYYYFNFWNILSATGKKLNPTWRRIDSEMFFIIESFLRGERKGKGLITLKRRRVGMSCISGAAADHEIRFYPFSTIGIQSKSETDIQIYLNEKIKFGFDRVPYFLYQEPGRYYKMGVKLGSTMKEKQKNGTIRNVPKGAQSEIICKTPMDTSWEGSGLKWWMCDESGKVNNVRQMFDLTIPCLCDDEGFNLNGFPWLFGTAGDITDEGEGHKYLWYHADEYDLIRHFVPGWVGRNMDEYGNEDVEKSVRETLEKRYKMRNNEQSLANEIQKYPLTPEEAFRQGSSAIFPTVIINERITELEKHPIPMHKGRFEWKEEGVKPIFIPSNEGKVHILEHPQKIENLYVAGADPYDHRKKEGSGSAGSMWIYKQPIEPNPLEMEEIEKNYSEASFEEKLKILLSLGNLPILGYTDQPENPNDFYQQCLMAIIYYNCKILIEKNRVRMIGHFEDNGYGQYLERKPGRINQGIKRASRDKGLYMDADWKAYGIGLSHNKFSHHCNSIYYLDLLNDALTYDPDVQKKKGDRVDAHNITLVYLQDTIRRGIKARVNVENNTGGFKDIGYVKRGKSFAVK